MHVKRIGFTALKGGRHLTHKVVDLSADGPVGDRVFCLVDPSRGRVLRTVENPALLRACARWGAGVLSVDIPGLSADLPDSADLHDLPIKGVPAPNGQTLDVDYWGRTAALEVCIGPWAEAYSEYLGYEVVLCRPVAAGEVVYGASVTLVTTSSMRLLSRRLGRKVDSARFRSTFLVETGADSTPHVEDSWVGRELRVGESTLTVQGVVPRCAVVDFDPSTGRSDARVLRTLAEYRHSEDEISFGVDAVVSAAGRVRTGDQVRLEQGPTNDRPTTTTKTDTDEQWSAGVSVKGHRA